MNETKWCPLRAISVTNILAHGSRTDADTGCIRDECGFWSSEWNRCGIACIDAEHVEYQIAQKPVEMDFEQVTRG